MERTKEQVTNAVDSLRQSYPEISESLAAHYEETYSHLPFRSDFMFTKVMSNPKLCKKVIELLLGIEVENIIYQKDHHKIRITYHNKYIEMDMYVQDTKNNIFDLEMEQKKKERKELPKRTRYYQAMIDLNSLEKGAHYSELPGSFIIFICTFDPFSENCMFYTFKNICEENTALTLNDGAVKIFLNTEGTDETTPEEIKAFLKYVKNGTITTGLTKELDNEVQMVQKNVKWRDDFMMIIAEREMEERRHRLELEMEERRYKMEEKKRLEMEERRWKLELEMEKRRWELEEKEHLEMEKRRWKLELEKRETDVANKATEYGIKRGIEQAIEQTITILIEDALEDNKPREVIIQKLMKHYHLSEEDANMHYNRVTGKLS